MKNRRIAQTRSGWDELIAQGLREEAFRDAKGRKIAKAATTAKDELTDAAKSLRLLHAITGKQVFKDALDQMHALGVASRADMAALRAAEKVPLTDAMICYAVKRLIDTGWTLNNALERVATGIGMPATSQKTEVLKLKRAWIKWGQRGAEAGRRYAKVLQVAQRQTPQPAHA